LRARCFLSAHCAISNPLATRCPPPPDPNPTHQPTHPTQPDPTRPPTAKKTLNVGKSGLSAGLDDYVYDGVGVDDEYDFM